MMKNKTNAFTFVELLITIAIFSLLTLALYSSLSTGIIIWKRSKTEVQSLRTIRYLYAQTRNDLESAVSFSMLNFVGSADQFYFCSLSQTDIHTELKQLSKVEYQLAKQGNKVLGLSRTITNIQQGITENSESLSPNKIFMSEVQGMKLEYAYYDANTEKIAWLDSWKEENTLPPAIKFTWKITTRDNETNTYFQYIHLPPGQYISAPEILTSEEGTNLTQIKNNVEEDDE